MSRAGRNSVDRPDASLDDAAAPIDPLFGEIPFRRLDLVCRFDGRGQLSHVNEAFCKLVDRSREQLSGRVLQEFAAPRDSLNVRRQLSMLTAGGSAVETYRLVDGDGRERWIRWVARTVPGSGEFEALGHDVTAQTQAELAVAASEQRFRIAAECATDLIYECHFDGSDLNWYGARLRDTSLILPDCHTDWLATIEPLDRERVRRVFTDHLKSGEPYETEYRVTDSAGRIRHLVDRGSVTFDERGDPHKWIGAIDDVSDSRIAERRLRENQARLNYRLSLERVIGELSSRLHAGESEEDIAAVLRPVLGRLGSIMGLDRGYVVLLDADSGTFRRTQEWCADGVAPHPYLMRDVPTADWGDLFDAFAAGEVIHVESAEQAEPRFERLARYMTANGVRSLVTVPIFHDRQLGGVLGFESERRVSRWLAEDLRLLKTGAEIIGRAIGNLRHRARILKVNRQLEALDRLSRALSGQARADDVVIALARSTRDIFDAGRVEVVYPCDPAARGTRVCARALSSGADAAADETPIDALTPLMARALDAAPAAVPSGDGLYIALRARVGKPWLLRIDAPAGSAPWSPGDRELAAALAERAVDALSEALVLEQLRDNEVRLDEAQGVAHVGSWEADWSDNRLWWSREVFNIFEMSPSAFDAELDTFFRHVHPEDVAAARAGFDRALAERAPYDAVYRLQLPGGQLKHVNVRCITRFDDGGRPLRSIGTIQDVTARILFEDAMRQAQKLEAVGQLSGGIAHDFNNLLSIIIGNLDLVLRDVNTEPRFFQRVQTARRAAQRGADLTRKLLSVSRKNEPRPKQIDVNRVLTDMEELITRSLTPQVHVRTRLDDKLALAVVDPGALQDALLNLVINARDAMENGGDLVIATRNVIRDRPPRDAGGRGAVEHQVCISVTDSGVGMPPDIIERALEPFFTTKEPGKGTGLGLAMVYAFVTQAGGSLDIDSTPGQGTRVNLFLPADVEPATLEPTPGDERPAPVGGSEKILLVDDEPELIELAEEFLHELGYRTVIARDAREALERLAGEPDIDLVFSDILMPGGIDGYELARRARVSAPSVRVLLCSGYADRQGDADFDGIVLRKPYQPEELADAIRQVLSERPA